MKKQKDIKLYNCPYHDIQPWLLGPEIELPILFNGRPPRKDMMFWVLAKAFPDACLFESHYTVFCPECAKKTPTPNKHNKFGSGFTSQYSIGIAKQNWNKACLRFAKHSINDVLKGKIDVSMYDDTSKV